jgi:hypothetical protein
MLSYISSYLVYDLNVNTNFIGGYEEYVKHGVSEAYCITNIRKGYYMETVITTVVCPLEQ